MHYVAGPLGVRHGGLEVLQLVVQVAEAAAAGDGLVEHGTAGHLADVLAIVAAQAADFADNHILRPPAEAKMLEAFTKLGWK